MAKKDKNGRISCDASADYRNIKKELHAVRDERYCLACDS